MIRPQTRPQEASSAPPRAGVSPTFERVKALVDSLGADVELVHRQRHTLLRRRQVFGAIRCSPRRVELGLYLPGNLVGDRLTDGSSFTNNRVTHRVILTRPEEVDEQLRLWLRQAYERG